MNLCYKQKNYYEKNYLFFNWISLLSPPLLAFIDKHPHSIDIELEEPSAVLLFHVDKIIRRKTIEWNYSSYDLIEPPFIMYINNIFNNVRNSKNLWYLLSYVRN